MHKFQERHPVFNGFSEYFATEIEPKLSAKEADHLEAMSKVKKFAYPAAILTALILFAISWMIGSSDLALFALPLAILVFMSFYAYFVSAVRQHTKTVLVSSVFDYIGWNFEADCQPIKIDPWQNILLLPETIDKREFEDRISGSMGDVTFDSVEAVFKRNPNPFKGERKPELVFRGQLMQIRFKTNITDALTVVLRDKGMFNAKRYDNLKRVGLVDPVFEKIFEAYSTDQVSGRVVLHPAFMQTLVDLETALFGRNIRFAFKENLMLIAVETPNLFEAGSMKDPLSAPARAQRILNEVGAIFDIVDMLLEGQ